MIDQVRKWLNEQGYPLEMKTAAVFRKVGFEVEQSCLYADTESNKPREIDVLARVPDYIGSIRIIFLVECKASKKPWVLLSGSDVSRGNLRTDSFAVVNSNVRKVLSSFGDGKPFNALLNECSWFKKDSLIGYSLRNAFSDKDIAYEGLLGLAKASTDFVRSESDYQMCFVFPVLVVDSPLVRCNLDTLGKLQLEEIPEGEVFFKYGLASPFRTCIRVVTLRGLPEFVLNARRIAKFMKTLLSDSAAKLWKEKFTSNDYPKEMEQLGNKLWEDDSIEVASLL